MHYGEIKNCDIANGEGVRSRCSSPAAPTTVKALLSAPDVGFDHGQPFISETEQQLLDLLAPLTFRD